jgi:hypothetical protein
MKEHRSRWHRDTSWSCFSLRIFAILIFAAGILTSVHFVLGALNKEKQSWKFVEFPGVITSGRCHESLMDTAESSYINMNLTYQFQNLTHNVELKYAFDFCNLNNYCCKHLVGQKIGLCASYHPSDPSFLIDIDTACWTTKSYGWEVLEVLSLIGILIVGLIGMFVLWCLPTRRVITLKWTFEGNPRLPDVEEEIKL